MAPATPPVLRSGKAERLSRRTRRSPRGDIRRRAAIALGPERIELVISHLIGRAVDIRTAARIDQAGSLGDIGSVPPVDAGRSLHQRVQALLVGRVASYIEIEQIEARLERLKLHIDDIFF